MANEIIKLVAKKANIAEPIAQIAVDTVLNVVKGKLPAGVGGILDSFLGSSTAATPPKSKTTTTKTTTKVTKTTSKSVRKPNNPLGDLGSLAGTIGSLLGKK